jgi:hypothetical protein
MNKEDNSATKIVSQAGQHFNKRLCYLRTVDRRERSQHAEVRELVDGRVNLFSTGEWNECSCGSDDQIAARVAAVW